MKKIICLVGALFFLSALSAKTSELRALAQVMVSAEKEFKEVQKITPYIYGYAFSNVTESYFSLVGYGGVSIDVDWATLYLMAASYNDGFGLSAGPSVWLEFENGNSSFFIQGDYYIPWNGSADDPAIFPPQQYFAYAEYTKFLEDEKSFGLACEVMGAITDKAPYETAIGPFVGLGKMQLWGFYDLTPAYEQEDSYGLRITFDF